MSRDLISRKEAIDALYGSIFCADASPIIEYLPTAYDVEAVVRESETKSNGFFADDEEFGEMFVKTIPLPTAIEIVRGGRNE